MQTSVYVKTVILSKSITLVVAILESLRCVCRKGVKMLQPSYVPKASGTEVLLLYLFIREHLIPVAITQRIRYNRE